MNWLFVSAKMAAYFKIEKFYLVSGKFFCSIENFILKDRLRKNRENRLFRDRRVENELTEILNFEL
jgi:hypothetical protein